MAEISKLSATVDKLMPEVMDQGKSLALLSSACHSRWNKEWEVYDDLKQLIIKVNDMNLHMEQTRLLISNSEEGCVKRQHKLDKLESNIFGEKGLDHRIYRIESTIGPATKAFWIVIKSVLALVPGIAIFKI
jgi:hypothetical protein